MTTNDSTYAARLARLTEAGEGNTVTVPAGWAPPADLPDEHPLRNLEPGDTFENDGGDDTRPWTLASDALARMKAVGIARRWHTAHALAKVGLDVDQKPAPEADGPDDVDEDTDTPTLKRTGRDAAAVAADHLAVVALDALPVGATLTFSEPRDFLPGADRHGILKPFRITELKKGRDGLWSALGVADRPGVMEANFTLRTEHLLGLGVTAADFPGGETITVGESRINYNQVHVNVLDTSKAWFGPAGSTPPADGDLEAAGFKPLGWIDADGIALDPAPASQDPECCGCEECGKLCAGCLIHPGTGAAGVPAGETDDDGNPREHCTCSTCDPADQTVGSVTIELEPTIDEGKWARALGKAKEFEREAQVPLLDEWQLERVAALEHSLRILESRRTTRNGGTSIADLFRSSEVPAVGVQDMIDVAAFINDGDTGRIDEVQA